MHGNGKYKPEYSNVLFSLFINLNEKLTCPQALKWRSTYTLTWPPFHLRHEPRTVGPAQSLTRGAMGNCHLYWSIKQSVPRHMDKQQCHIPVDVHPANIESDVS